MFITLRASAVFTCLAAASLLIVFLGTPVNATGTFMSPEAELAEAVAYGKLRPFAPDEERLDCVRAAAKLAKEMNEVSRNAAKAQVIYDRDPDSQAGIAAEQSIELMDSLASRLGKQLHDTTVECAKRVVTIRAAVTAVQLDKTKRATAESRAKVVKTYRAKYEDSPLMRQERAKCYAAAEKIAAEAEALANDFASMSPDLLSSAKARAAETRKRAEDRCRLLQAGALDEQLVKMKNEFERKKVERERALEAARVEETTKMALRNNMTDLVATKLNQISRHYRDGRNTVASEELEKLGAVKALPEHPSPSATAALKLDNETCDHHFAMRMTRLQK